MNKKKIKQLFYKLFNGFAFPVVSKQLRGMKLIVDPLMPAFHFWRNVDIKSHLAYDNVIKDGDVIFDVGGNVGVHSLYFAKKFNNTKVYAFEPLPDNIAYFKKIIAINKVANIRLMETAVGTQTGKIYFDKSLNNHQGHISNEVSDLSVNITTLDDFIKKENVYPDFIKIDVEGYEGDVLSGFQEMVAKGSASVIVELHSAEQCKRVADFFRPHPYTIYRLADDDVTNKIPLFTEVKNTSENGEIPANFGGTILGVPVAKAAKIKVTDN